MHRGPLVIKIHGLEIEKKSRQGESVTLSHPRSLQVM